MSKHTVVLLIAKQLSDKTVPHSNIPPLGLTISTTTEPELLSSKFVVFLVNASCRTASATHFYRNLHVANPLPEMDMYLLMRCNFRKRRTMPSILSNCSLGINFEQCTSTRVVNFLPSPKDSKIFCIVMLLQRTLAQLQNGKGFSFEIKNRLYFSSLSLTL